MRVDKVILRAALSTLAAIVLLFAFMIFALCFIYPSTMMELTYSLGMDGASIKYADRAYSRSNDVYYAAFAMEVAIGMDDDANIEKYGLLFIRDDEFVTYCDERDQALNASVTYEQYAYGQVSLAQYRQGEKTEAVETAFDGVDGEFPRNNAVVVLLATALSAGDTDIVNGIKTKMDDMKNGLTDTTYFNEVYGNLFGVPGA